MKRLPPKRIGRVIGMGADANGLNPGDAGYDSTSDPNSGDYVLQAGDIGTHSINANSVPEGSTSQVSTGSGTLNAITPGPGGTLQIPEITVYGTVPTTSSPTHTQVGPQPSASALASMSILGLPWWVVLAAVGVATVFAALEMRGPRRTGTRRRKKGKRAPYRAAARRRTARRGRRGGRRRNPILSSYQKRQLSAYRRAYGAKVGTEMFLSTPMGYGLQPSELPASRARKSRKHPRRTIYGKDPG